MPHIAAANKRQLIGFELSTLPSRCRGDWDIQSGMPKCYVVTYAMRR